MQVYLYVLKDERGLYYTGITNNLGRRFEQHKHGLCKSTAHYLNISIIHHECFNGYKAAREKEVYIHRLGNKKYIARLMFITGQINPPKSLL